MPKILSVVVVGAGTVAQAVHLPLLRRRWDRFTLSALVDISPRRRQEAAEVFGVPEDRRFENVTELVAAIRAKQVEVDAALVASDGLHVEDVLALVRRGIPVLVEPPLGFSEDEIRQVVQFERMAGRRLVMIAHPQVFDAAVTRLAETVKARDLRMLDYEVLMPATQPMYGHAHVTASAYDLDTDLRMARRDALQKAVEAGSGDAATQRDRDLYVKGLLTGLAHQVAVVLHAFGPFDRIEAVRHWPSGVVPGSVEVLARLEGDAPVRLVWHYLPFAPEYVERIDALTARRRLQVRFALPSHLEERGEFSLREKDAGLVTETTRVSPTGPAEAMWEAFHEMVDRGTEPRIGAQEALEESALMRQLLARIVELDGRSIDSPADEGADSDTPAVTGAGKDVTDGDESAQQAPRDPEPEAVQDPAPDAEQDVEQDQAQDVEQGSAQDPLREVESADAVLPPAPEATFVNLDADPTPVEHEPTEPDTTRPQTTAPTVPQLETPEPPAPVLATEDTPTAVLPALDTPKSSGSVAVTEESVPVVDEVAARAVDEDDAWGLPARDLRD
ncbi:Gfo/Idh/MocA family oxidoreductase [Brachybacterium sp. EF45031]|uniref:Gfo/Idh/MocA family oxidoreductase n=1 Tax=Brachybacterium sillae TaxID=2810536 RepID=UPI00217DCDEC|nr:Gfo/Idh/MocA family oxidoreductase [Brachybacterium sillae]MCS6712224.1 Gfo/Idh/MocA family oxidoreductase [Brachybacterium sillae]